MYIKDGIAYADNREPILEVVSVRPLENFRLWLRFNNGKTKEFDFKPLLDKPAFQPLKNKAVFNDVYVDYGVTVWRNGEIDIAPEFLLHN